MNRIRRHLAIAATLAILAGALLEPGPLFAARGGPIVISEQLTIVPSRRHFVVCQDEARKLSLDVFVRVVYRLPTDARSRRRIGNRAARTNVRVQATSSNPSVAAASPPFLDFPPGSNPQSIEVTGDQEGATTLTIQDTVGFAQPVTVTVSVIECVIKVKSTSVWNMNFNYALTAYGTMPDVTLVRTSKDRYVGQGTLYGQASADSIGGCTPRYTIGDSSVTISAKITGSAGHQILTVMPTYSAMAVATTVNCRGVGGGRGDTGRPIAVTYQAVAFQQQRSVSPVPHEASTGMGLQPGNTEFVTWTEEVVPTPP